MRIGIDVRALMEGRTTGVQIYIKKLLHALFHLDQANEYVLFANSFANIGSRVQVFQYPNVKYAIFGYPNKLFNLSQKFLSYPKIDGLLGGVDLFFSPHWRSIALSSGIPLVVTVHDLAFQILPDLFTSRQRLWHWFMDYKEAAGRASLVVAVSESTKRDLIDIYKLPPQKISVVNSGVSLASEPESVPGLPEKYFLHFATFEPRKNLDAVIAAYEHYATRHPDPRPLVLAGSSGWKTEPRISNALKSRVTILQDVSEGQKLTLYQHAFVLLFLSFYEGFGFPILEAASQGVPVIASLDTSLAEIGRDFALFVNPFRPAQIAEAMLWLERDERFYATLQAKGLRAAETFSWDRSAGQMLQLFQGLSVAAK